MLFRSRPARAAVRAWRRDRREQRSVRGVETGASSGPCVASRLPSEATRRCSIVASNQAFVNMLKWADLGAVTAALLVICWA